MVIKVSKYLSHSDVKCYQVYKLFKKDGGVFCQTKDKINAANIQSFVEVCVCGCTHTSVAVHTILIEYF